MNKDTLYEILLNLNIHDIQNIYVTNNMFNDVLISKQFWDAYFAKYNMSIHDQPFNNVNQWVSLFMFNIASKVINSMVNRRATNISTRSFNSNQFNINVFNNDLDIITDYNNIDKSMIKYIYFTIMIDKGEFYFCTIGTDPTIRLFQRRCHKIQKEEAIKYIFLFIKNEYIILDNIITILQK